MKIAVLAWDPLVDDPSWRPNGPLLPIEFAKTAPQGGLIPVLCGEPWVLPIQTLWAVSPFDDFDEACNNVAAREGVILDEEIGHVQGNNNSQCKSLPDGNLKKEVLNRLEQWRHTHGFDAVIWRDSQADFLQGQNLDEARVSAVTYLQTLHGDAEAEAARNIRRVPLQVWTPIRASISTQLGWIPEPPPLRIKTADDLRFKEWEQCRTTIGRLDTILVDLRKVGFSLVTGLLTASSLLGFLGIGIGPTTPAHPSPVSAAVFIAIMVLVAALFSIDTYYQALISGAADRALDLEIKTDPPIRITKHTSTNALRSKTNYIILFLYLALLTVTGGLGLLATGGLNLPPWPTEALFWTWILVVALEVIGLILASRDCLTQPKWLKRLQALALVPWVIIGALSCFFAAKSSGILPWIVCCIGTALALCIGIYWIYVSIKLHLNREKERPWPPDPWT